MDGLLLRVRRDRDGCVFWARSAGSKYPAEAAIRHLDAELEAARRRDAPAALVRPLQRIDGDRQSWLLYEAGEAEPLDATQALSLEEFWDVASALAGALAAEHKAGRVHGRLEASCVWWDGARRRAGLLGMLPEAGAELAHCISAKIDTAPELAAGEHRKVRASADVYSLGAIFYRLLSGKPAILQTGDLAFDVAANAPARLEGRDVPEGLADLVARMLSKSPASRPADAGAVALELASLRAGHRAPRRSVLFGPAPIVGRARELAVLEERVREVESGASGIVCVSGEPGVGKSRLLAELLRKEAAAARLIAHGKFQQLHGDRPYSALLSACGNALAHVLAGDDRVFTSTKQRLRAASAELLGVLSPDIPELEHLCGELPPPAAAGPTENRNRFKRAFGELLSALCSAEAPLLLALDDVQWADRATADLLADLIAAGLPEHLLLLLAYRETAARENEELKRLLEVTESAPLVRLGPFEREQTLGLCRALVPDCEGLEALSAVAQSRSQGNALHCVELLKNFVATGELEQVAGRWRYVDRSGSLQELSDTVAELIRNRLTVEPRRMQNVLAAAACIGRSFSKELLAAAAGEEADNLTEPLERAVRHGFLAASPGASYSFCHDRIQQVALEECGTALRSDIYLRLGRWYRARINAERGALFHCLDCLNLVRERLDPSEQRELAHLNLEGARTARATIAYDRAIPLVRRYLEAEPSSAGERFEALLLLSECLLLSSAARDTPEAKREKEAAVAHALEQCTALANTSAEKLKLLYSRLLFCVHNQDYAGGVELGLAALNELGEPLPKRPGLPRVLWSVLRLFARMQKLEPDSFAERPDRTNAHDLEVFRFLVGLWGPSHWTNPLLNALVCVRLVEMTLRCGNGAHSSMALISYAAMCHMRENHALAVRYGRVARALARDHSPYTRAIVRFLSLTFFGVLEHPPHEVIRRYDEALAEGVAHGEIVASHIIDGAVTTLPHLGPELPQVEQALKRYESEARAMGATTSLEMIGFVRAWSRLQSEGPGDCEANQAALGQDIENASFTASRDLLRMQIEYLFANDEQVLELAESMRGDMVLKGNPLHRACHALFLILAATRARGKLTRPARRALAYLKRLNALRIDGDQTPRTFLPTLRLAQGVHALTRRDPRALTLLEEAAAEAAAHNQGQLRAIALERLARAHAASGDLPAFMDRIRDAAHAYRRFGAHAKAEALMREYPALDWTPQRTRASAPTGLQVEGIMRAASAIAEVTSARDLGSTLLRVIATAAGAMRAFLFTRVDDKLRLVAACERDGPSMKVTPAPLDELDPRTLALKPVRRVERTHALVELPKDRPKFLDDPYLVSADAPRALLCVPLLYRGDLAAVLYLENRVDGEPFGPDEVKLVTLLGQQAAIALTIADTHRLEIEAIQSKVNPHFLYNALSVIAELVGRAPEEAEEAVYRLTRLYRYMLSSPTGQKVPLERELALVRDYLELEKARFGERLRVRWDIESNALSFQVPVLLVQPLAENAVNHGIRRNVGGGTVRISARVEDDCLRLGVSDDGPGWYEGAGGTGFGLKSVRRRLELVYGKQAELQILKHAGVAVELTIPASLA